MIMIGIVFTNSRQPFVITAVHCYMDFLSKVLNVKVS